MQQNYYLIHQETVTQEDEALLFEGINQEAIQVKGMDCSRTFGIFIKDKEENVLGGVKGATFYGCLYVICFGLIKVYVIRAGETKLMLEEEKIGKNGNCTFATVNTMDWEAVSFYQKLGYEIEFTREGYEKGSKMFLLRKKL